MLAQLGNDLGRLPVELTPFIEGQRDLAHLEPGHQLRPFLAGAGFQLVARVPALGVFGDQRRAVSGFIGTVLPVQFVHLADFILGRALLPRQFGELLADFALPPGDLH